MKKIIIHIIFLMMLFNAFPVFSVFAGDAATPPAANPLGVAPTTSPATPAPTDTKPSEGKTLEETDVTIPSNLPTFQLEKIKDPVQGLESFLLKYVLSPIFMLAAGIAVFMILFASFKLITAAGQEEALTKSKNILMWALVGLGVIMLAYTIILNLARIIRLNF